MPTFRRASVREVISERPGLQRLRVECQGALVPAYALTTLTGPCSVGDELIVNTTAVELALGTGGSHVVHWNLSRDEWVQPGPGHIMKVRYTSVQLDSGAAEESAGDIPADLRGMPVVACSLHSQVAVVAAAARAIDPKLRVAYVMTDGAALPAAFSELNAALRSKGFLAATITAGHAFGGDLEAVTVPSALTLARHRVGADLTIVGMGPGVVGTGTTLGTTAVEAASIIDSTAALGGQPIACVRASSADARGRHQGVSHHTLTALGLARSPALVPIAANDAEALESTLANPPVLNEGGGRREPHRVVVVDDLPDAAAELATAGIRVTSMGRELAADAIFARCAVAAGACGAKEAGAVSAVGQPSASYDL